SYYNISILFFIAPPTTQIYTLSLHDALPISGTHGSPHSHRRRRAEHRHPARVPDARKRLRGAGRAQRRGSPAARGKFPAGFGPRSEEHTSELQSRGHLVCRLLLEKKKKIVTL